MNQSRHVHKKQFGQHFLHDDAIVANIVRAIAPRAGEHVVEIGPGDGALTLPLLRALGKLTVIELDRDLVPRLEKAAQGVGELSIVNADVLGVDWRIDLGEAFDRVGHKVAIQGNMDPCKLYAPIPAIEAEVKRLAAQVAGRPGHIFNLGHGILPDVPVAHAQAFVRAVKELRYDAALV